MSVSSENILQNELIGLKVEVTESTNETLENKRGVLVDETRNTFTLNENGELKKKKKKEITLLIQTPEGEKVKVKGRKLVVRPEDRTKKLG